MRWTAGARVLAFLAGPPDRGPGSVLQPSAAKMQTVTAKQQPVMIDSANPEASFYLPDPGATELQDQQVDDMATSAVVPVMQVTHSTSCPVFGRCPCAGF